MTYSLQTLPGTPVPQQSQMVLAAIIASLLLFAAAIVLPIADLAGPVHPHLLTALNTGLGTAMLVTAVLLYSRANPADPGFAWMGAAFLFSACMVFAIVPALPPRPDSVLAEEWNSPRWLWMFWHIGFAGIIGTYAATGGRTRLRLSPMGSIIAVLGGALVPVLLATYFVDLLPGLERRAWAAPLCLFALLANVISFAMVAHRLRARSQWHLWLALAMVASSLDVVLTIAGGSEPFTVGWYAARGFAAAGCLAVLQAMLVDIGDLFRRVAAANAALDALVHVDALSGLSNRRHFDETLANEWRRARREDTPLSLVMLELDFHEAFADRYGQDDADQLVRQIATLLRERVRRAADSAARYAPGRFALLLPVTDHQGAMRKTEQIRIAIRGLNIPHALNPHDIATVSAGVATLWPAGVQSGEDLLTHAAERALSRAQQSGRDMAVSETMPEPERADRRAGQSVRSGLSVY